MFLYGGRLASRDARNARSARSPSPALPEEAEGAAPVDMATRGHSSLAQQPNLEILANSNSNSNSQITVSDRPGLYCRGPGGRLLLP